MDSQKLAGILGTIVALLVIAGVVIYGPKSGKDAPKPVETAKPPAAAAPPVRGPVIREVPN